MARRDAINETLKLFKIFSDETRLRIISLLVDGEYCVQDICAHLDMSQSSISHQLKHLRDLDVVKTRRDGKHIFYTVKDAQVKMIYAVGYAHANEPKL